EEVKVTVENGVLSISGERKYEKEELSSPHPTAPASWRTPIAPRGTRPRAKQRAPAYGVRELAPALGTAHEAGGAAEIRRAVAAKQSASWLARSLRNPSRDGLRSWTTPATSRRGVPVPADQEIGAPAARFRAMVV